MKPKNSPARKLARQIAASDRSNGLHVTVAGVRLSGYDDGPIDAARAVRTKKARGVSR